MANLVVTNISSTDLFLSDLYTTLAPGQATAPFERPISALSAMLDLQHNIVAGKCTLTTTYTTDEIASGLAFSLPDTALFRAVLTAGVQDIPIFAVNALPYKFRVVNAWAILSTAGGAASTITVNTRTAAAGTRVATIANDGAPYGAWVTQTATALATPGATEGLFVNRVDLTSVGEVYLLVRSEA